MPTALGEGWLVAIAAVVVPLLLALGRWIASRWREPLRQEKAENKLLKDEAVARTEALTEAKIRGMYLEAKLDYCESELENWRSGKWGQP